MAGNSGGMAEMRARLERLEGRVAELENALAARPDDGHSAPAPTPLAAGPGDQPVSDPNDPFVSPDWTYDHKRGVYKYLKHAEVCPVCKIGVYPLGYHGVEKGTQKSFIPLGTKPVRFKDIGPRKIVIRKQTYRCRVLDCKTTGIKKCYSAFQQDLPGGLFHDKHRMTQRLYNHIIDLLNRPHQSMRMKRISEATGVSRRVLYDIEAEQRDAHKPVR
jgi:hypothetical protein